jgi:Na+-transporting NADH:ubiquinone oxidoreductase subunit A
MADFKVKRGYDVPLVGAPESVLADSPRPTIVSIRPNEFRAVKPKILVTEGETVTIGQPLFLDRARPEIRFPSPGAGEVVEVRYGARRVCEEIFVRLSEDRWTEHTHRNPDEIRKMNRAQIVEALLDTGLWTSLRKRPFSTIPNADATPEAIFVSASDSSPLAFDSALAVQGREADFQIGIDVLGRLTEGKVHVCLAAGADHAPFRAATHCEHHTFSGPYPSGQIEVQIHYVLPYKKGREVWFLDCQDVAAIGETLRTGHYSVSRVVAVGGENATHPRHFRSRRGVALEHLDPQASPARSRVVSGNALSGTRVSTSSGLGHHDCKFSVIPEVEHPEFIGWMLPGFDKVSRYRAYASALAPPKKPHITTGLGGGVRAHVATGIYEDVCAVDILPPYLMKAILVNEVEEAESLGLHDCAECGLCTYVCPSKIEFGEIFRQGIDDYLKEEEV